VPEVEVVDYDPTWPGMADAEIARLGEALGSVAVAIDHVGSTAVPGLAAKPTIDVQVFVAEIEPFETYGDPLTALGYAFVADPDFPTFHFFARPADPPRTHHVHVCEPTDAVGLGVVAVRDYLRAQPAEAAAYADHKRAVAAAHPDSMDGYVAAKHAFVQALQARALAWAAQR
jgi:GrpB-like predicted nucleotidyltransferase (UPF0157 family)